MKFWDLLEFSPPKEGDDNTITSQGNVSFIEHMASAQ